MGNASFERLAKANQRTCEAASDLADALKHVLEECGLESLLSTRLAEMGVSEKMKLAKAILKLRNGEINNG